MPTYIKQKAKYKTWYHFKRDLEAHVGYAILNWDWLKIKPKVSLPWSYDQMNSALLELEGLHKQQDP